MPQPVVAHRLAFDDGQRQDRDGHLEMPRQPRNRCTGQRRRDVDVSGLMRMTPLADDLERFVRAQAPIYAQALAELQRGRKTSHWMWFVFPQLRGLGHSDMAFKYGLAGRDEAAAYLAHPILGPRLLACVDALLRHRDHDADEIFGHVDALKLRSSLTLFAEVAPAERRFREALAVFYGGRPDAATLRLLVVASLCEPTR